MIEEPEITPDDTSPRKAINNDEKLRAEEPPISDEDTSPRRVRTLDERLAAEEPPVSVDDTSPSAIGRPPRKTSRMTQRVIGFVMLLASLALTLLAVLIWINDEEKPRPMQNGTPTAAALVSTPTVMPPQTEMATVMPTQMATDAPSLLPTAQFVFPTAAADEIAAALLTPVAGKPVAGAVGRHSEPFTIRSAESRASVTLYTVQEGDTLESVAGKFGLNDYWTLIWSNSRNKVSPLRPGAQINIMPEDGVYYEVTDHITITQLAEKYQVTPYDIIDSEYNPDLFGATPETLLVAGMWVVIPGGKGEQINLLAANPNSGSSGSGGGGGAVSGAYNLWGCSSNITGGTNPVQRPLQYYTWMRGLIPGGHDGVDLAADEGDPVYAAGSGTVAFAGWNNYGFGNVVVIAHGSVFSIYGHLHDYAVRCGGYVDAGQVIGSVGNTGNSSGSHLHFELRDANWNLLNPQSYVGF